MTTAQVAAVPRERLLPPTTGRAGFADALRSEFTKIRSTRSTYWTLLAMVVVTIGFGALACAGAASHGGARGPEFDAAQRSLVGLYLGQLIIAVLGALTITSEYSTGMVRTSLTVQPRRGTLFAAKAAVFAAISLVTGLVTCFASFFIGQAILSRQPGLSVTLSDPNVLRAVIGGALFLTACGMLAYGLGAILRHTAGAITAAIGLLFVVTVLVNFLPTSWQNHIDKWTPAMAGAQIWTTKAAQPPPQLFSAWAGFAVLAGWAIVAMVAGLALFRGRDA
jgi:ABC-2 type transport system permease protein